ncbi:cell morphogenesis C-terminal-domain-containing protein [Mycotypha africana]|uniref:cell morphogenesis C-terminal-domain-containing protein n=1 Tax=Mycotypha africana TaxID=64632 RepID=UPI002300D182|nr:cell morphogenesis C-terminal-domain-containing protein [Mycotypha africana]KAI8991091.1 cell morphogenesis C-terminal-domain-containing protein [Mycotypha africana]
MPRIMPAGIQLKLLVDMLARYTVHTDPDVIKSASSALLRIAAQIDSKVVVVAFADFISKIEDKFSDVVQSLASGPLLITATGGSSLNEAHGGGGVLKLYVDLLTIWVNHVETTKGRGDLNVKNLMELVRQTEANGLLFLCHQSTSVRRFATQIIELASKVASGLNIFEDNSIANNEVAETEMTKDEHQPRPKSPKEWTHLNHLLEFAGQILIQFDKDTNTLENVKLNSDLRNRLMQYQKRSSDHVLRQLAESDNPLDITIWNICLPRMFKLCFEYFQQATAECRRNICTRLLQIQPSISMWVETMKTNTTGTLSMAKSSSASHNRAASPETIEQWRIYLIFACATAVPAVNPTVSSLPIWSHVGRKVAGSNNSHIDRITTPRDLFRLITPYLICEHRQIRESAIEGLGNINRRVHKSLMSELESYIKIILDDGKQRSNQKPYQNKRSKKNDRLRISIMHVLDLTADCLKESEEAMKDKESMNIIMSYIKETKSFLMDTEVQMEWEYQRLRIHLCGLVKKLYENIMRLDNPTSLMSFEMRLSLYKMFEEWCGYGATAKTAQQREATMMHEVLEECKDPKERAAMTKLMEEERRALEFASLNAMATLCQGPLYAYLGQKKARQAIIQFDTLNVLRWIDAIFESRDPKYHVIARRALEAVMMYNEDQSVLLDDIIEQCYAGNPKLEFTQGYFQALADIVTKVEDYPCHTHQIMSLALFKTGDAKKAIRKTAINLLRVIEERVFADSCAKEYEIGITSSLPAIYKHTQTLLSARLALDHPEQTFSMLSEVTQRFEHITPSSQREVLTYMLPWHRKVDLSIGPHDTELSASAYMVLSNLYYITVKFGDIYVKEIAALWSQLVDYGRNARAIIIYLLNMGQETRNPWFMIHAKRIFVCLGRTHAFPNIIDEVIAEIAPRSMVPQVKEASQRHANAFPMLFVAEADKVLPAYPKKPVFSRGQLALTFLVDLAIEAGADLAPHLPLLLHCIFVQLDHLTSIVCDQSRCLLINLIHSIVVRQSMDTEASQKASEIIQCLVSKEGKRLWAYENITPTHRRISSANELKDLLQRVIEVFSYEDWDLRQKWGETALKWATCCSVRHIACRSFQCFRALMPAFNQHMLADMLARLSNTIADKSDDIRGFALEIILTLTEVAKAMDKAQIEQFPQLFWAAVACLYSPYESEHCEALLLLDVVLQKYELVPKLVETFPKDWSSEFDGLQPLLLKGLQFSSAEKDTFRILKYISLQSNLPLIDPTETRLMYLILGSIPRLLHGLDNENENAYTEAKAWAEVLLELLEGYGLVTIHRVLSTYAIQKAKFQEDFLKQILGSMRDIFLHKYIQQAFMFSLRMVKNKIPYYREKTLLLIENLVPYITDQFMRPAHISEADLSIDIAALEPLLQLVSTEYADRALAILNSGINTVTNGNNRIMNDESELIWGFNNFAAAAKITRHNIHAVVFECSFVSNEIPFANNIQFSVEDLSMLTGEGNSSNNLVTQQHSGNAYQLQTGGLTNAPVGYGDDLMDALKDLDDFFNEDGEPVPLNTTNNNFQDGDDFQREGEYEEAADLSGTSYSATPPQTDSSNLSNNKHNIGSLFS